MSASIGSSSMQGGGRSARHILRSGCGAIVLGGLVLGGLALAVFIPGTAAGLQDRIISDAWHRALDAEPQLVPAFDRADQGHPALVPTSSAEAPKPLVVGDRVTVVTPDGAVLNLSVCDPASPSATTAPQCLNAYLARAVPPASTRPPQRSL